jgi:Na+-driven multidrug efflux pump
MSCSILRSLDKQDQTALINFSCFIIIGVSLGYLFGFVLKGGLKGIWYATCVAGYLELTIFAILFYKMNWEK